MKSTRFMMHLQSAEDYSMNSRTISINRLVSLTRLARNILSMSGADELGVSLFWDSKEEPRQRKKYFSRIFIIALVLSVLLNLAAFLYGAGRGYNAYWTELAAIRDDYNRTYTSSLTADIIFGKNIFVALAAFIPFLGLVLTPYFMYNTGFYAGALARIWHYDNYLPFTLRMFQDPVGILEFSACTLAVAESMTILHSIFAGEGLVEGRIVQHSWKTILVVVLFLAVAALLEAAELGSL